MVDNLKIKRNVSLKPLTSMYVGGRAKFFTVVRNLKEVIMAINFSKDKGVPFFVLGGGSNIVVSDRGFSGLVIKIEIKGRKKIKEDRLSVDYEVGAGESWDGFVSFAVRKKLYGIENCSHIPGTVGASVVQNIGAYGEEVSSSVVSVYVFDVKENKEKIFFRKDLNFSYRKSRFNDSQGDRGRFVILKVVFRLKKKGNLNIKYNDIKKYFSEHPRIKVNLITLRKAIIDIRNSKFPFPEKPEKGSVGSFWNTKVVDEQTFEKIIKKLRAFGFEKKADEIDSKRSVFKVAQGYKITPGLFVEILGYKGKKVGGAKILETHAGIINNFTGRAKAKDIYSLSNEIIKKVNNKFGVELKIEPELVGDFD